MPGEYIGRQKLDEKLFQRTIEEIVQFRNNILREYHYLVIFRFNDVYLEVKFASSKTFLSCSYTLEGRDAIASNILDLIRSKGYIVDQRVNIQSGECQFCFVANDFLSCAITKGLTVLQAIQLEERNPKQSPPKRKRTSSLRSFFALKGNVLF